MRNQSCLAAALACDDKLEEAKSAMAEARLNPGLTVKRLRSTARGLSPSRVQSPAQGAAAGGAVRMLKRAN